MNLIPRILSFSLLALLLLWKWRSPAGTLALEIFTDSLMVLLALGFGELLFTYLGSIVRQATLRIQGILESMDRRAAWNSLKQLLVAACLLAAGTISPSNGIDEGFRRDPVEMIVETLLIIAVFVVLYSLIKEQSVFINKRLKS